MFGETMKLIILISMAMILSGCATSGKSDYMSMEAKYSTETKNINFENPIPLKIETLEKVGLMNEDPLFKFNGYVSHYKVLKLQVEATQKYKIDLWSVCDCFIPKKIINPIFEIYTAKGLVVQSKVLESKVEDVNWEIKRPLSVHNVYEFESAQEQYVYVVLAANNENVGKPLTTIKTNAYAPGVEIPLSISVISHPVGSFELVASKK
jgi:hypothetical protein